MNYVYLNNIKQVHYHMRMGMAWLRMEAATILYLSFRFEDVMMYTESVISTTRINRSTGDGHRIVTMMRVRPRA